MFSVLVPAVCLLWFMNAAMRNERLAAQQRLAGIYRSRLATARSQLHQDWAQRVKELAQLVSPNPAPSAFARCVRLGLVDSVLIFDERGRLSYPNSPSAIPGDFGELESKWQEARHFEHVRRHEEAAQAYHALAQASTNTHLAARARQAEARCLVQAGQKQAAIQLIQEVLAAGKYDAATDFQGRLIVANAELLALELSTNRSSAAFRSTAQRLTRRLNDYENPVLASSQRRFLMNELRELRVEGIDLDTWRAEQLAAEWSGARPMPTGSSALQASVWPDFWQFSTADRRALGLIKSDRLAAWAKVALGSDEDPLAGKVQLVPPQTAPSDSLASLPAGESWPGWQLTLSSPAHNLFGAGAERQVAIYLWTGILILSVVGALAFLTLRLLRRQLALARLKNDLAATVSHELKTPVSAIRLLVDTLLEGEAFDPQRTREYLQLISQESERLGRVIQSFLDFSRMQREKHLFQFTTWSSRDVAEAAVALVRSRYEPQGFQFELMIQGDPPVITADRDALTTALVNLLDNACKYSSETKRINLQVRREDGRIIFSVKDYGIGIPGFARKMIFQPFYQVDERLSRKRGGCGLGLSIVQFIARGHGGCVSVESQPGCGSTFSIVLPIGLQTTTTGRKENG